MHHRSAPDPRTAPAPGAARPPAGSRPAPFPGAPDAARADIVVEARDVVRVYGSGEARVVALGGVSLSVERGQFVAVMGPSGSGKSTLLHCLAGLDSPTSGSVLIAGEDLAGMNDKQLTRVRRDRLGFVFQAFNLLPTLSAEENILLPLRLARRRPDEQWYRAVIDSLGIADRLDHRPNELSGGQQQRVAVARALAGRPEVVFADEPTGALDTASAASLLQALAAMCANLGQTVVMVTHDENAAAATNRIIRLTDGRITTDNPPHHTAPAGPTGARHAAPAGPDAPAAGPGPAVPAGGPDPAEPPAPAAAPGPGPDGDFRATVPVPTRRPAARGGRGTRTAQPPAAPGAFTVPVATTPPRTSTARPPAGPDGGPAGGATARFAPIPPARTAPPVRRTTRTPGTTRHPAAPGRPATAASYFPASRTGAATTRPTGPLQTRRMH